MRRQTFMGAASVRATTGSRGDGTMGDLLPPMPSFLEQRRSSPSLRRVLRTPAWSILCAILLAFGSAAAQDENATPPPTEAPTEEAKPADPIAARIQELEAIEKPDDEQTAELNDLKASVTFTKQAAASVTNTQTLADKVKAAPDQLAQVQKDLDAARAEVEAPIELDLPPVPERATAAALTEAMGPINARLESAKAQQQAAQELVRNAAKQVDEHAARKLAIPQEIATAAGRREDVQQLIAALPDGGEMTPPDAARKAALTAEADALTAKLDELDQELRTVEARSALRAKRAELLAARSQHADRVAGAVQQAVDTRKAAIAARRTAEAEAAQREATSRHEVIRNILEFNATLAAERQEIAARQRARNTEVAEIDGVIETWEASLDQIETQIERVGLNDVVGIRLHNLRGRVLGLRRYEQSAREVWSEIRSTQTRGIQLESRVFEDARVEAQRLLDASREAVPADQREEILAAASEALQTQKEYLDKLDTERHAYIDDTLLKLHERQVKLTDLVQKYLDFIHERILWIQSAPPISLRNVGNLGRSFIWLVDPEQWAEVGGTARTQIREHPFISALGFLPFVGLVSLGPLLRRRLDHLATKTKRASTDRFVYTVRSTYITILLALKWPSLVWGVWRLFESTTVEPLFVHGIATGLARLAQNLLLITLTWHLCRPRGLGEAHFRWRSDHLRLVRYHLRWVAVIVLPVAFIVALTDRDAYRIYLHSLGRLTFCIAMIAMGVAAWRVFHPTRGLFERVIARHPGGWVDRLRALWFPLFVGFTPALAVGACAGYFLTARELFQRVLESGWLVLIALIVFTVLLRLLYVVQRQLALEQARRRFEAEREAAREARDAEREARETGQEVAPLETEGSDELPQMEELELDVEAVSAQTRRLIVSGFVVIVLLGLFFVWREVLPAFGILERIVLWVPSSATIVEGSGIVPAEAITGADVGRALLVALVTLAIARNIPGALEIVVLQRLPMSAGARYTVTTLVRYTILIVGIVLTFDAIGIGWAKVQWLAAAVSVGLGFGLQEIFANFVSGLIILTERPVRVGDTVTIGTTSGVISRIQMRATTVVDWDRKELIIPNKQFVTGEIVNWTLSNAVLRITLKIGLAYGSDTATAERLMLAVAEADPSVRDNPPPRAFFIGFGDNSLDFELRIFIDDVDNFSAIRHRLNNAIDAAFREANIEIAFPQRDLHIRSSDITLGGSDPR
ncbi:MAG: mechanosensitive ion channel [Planctomycetes bacterium]|nr:mechanosensitive ion channel [Planctomycetota bacterium]